MTKTIRELISQKRLNRINKLMQTISKQCNAKLSEPKIYYGDIQHPGLFLILYPKTTSNIDKNIKLDFAFLQIPSRRTYDIDDILPLYREGLLEKVYHQNPNKFAIFEILTPDPEDTMNLMALGKSSEISKKLGYKSARELITDAKKQGIAIAEQYYIDDYYLITKGICGVPLIILPVIQPFKYPEKTKTILETFNICLINDTCNIKEPIKSVMYVVYANTARKYNNIAKFIADYQRILG